MVVFCCLLMHGSFSRTGEGTSRNRKSDAAIPAEEEDEDGRLQAEVEETYIIFNLSQRILVPSYFIYDLM